ncbi:MAG: hypothetical protein R3C53_18975 [Pirellulaceae bacterium]
MTRPPGQLPNVRSAFHAGAADGIWRDSTGLGDRCELATQDLGIIAEKRHKDTST